ncbi:MAG: DeoR/GlpR family DNA-binding transcription regulator [Eubacteriales bacterium]
MFGIERLQAIRELIKEKKSVEVTHLSKELNVSEVTIRRDLDKLEKEGLVVKTYGGAILLEDNNSTQETIDSHSQVEDSRQNTPLKSIASTAIKLVDSGDTVFVGGSKIGNILAEELKKIEDLIVVTNSLEIAVYLFRETNHKVVILGGEVDPISGNVLEFDQLDELLIEKVFITVDGVDQQFGYTVNDKSDVRLYKKLKDVSRDLIVLAENTVYEKRGLVKLAPLTGIHTVVTEKHLPNEFKSFYYQNNIKVHTTMLT